MTSSKQYITAATTTIVAATYTINPNRTATHALIDAQF